MRLGYAQIHINISVNSCKGSPKKEVQDGIGTQALPVSKETWPLCGRDCNVWGSMPPNSSLWLPIRSWWWNALRNGEFVPRNGRPQCCHLSPKNCVSVCAGMLSLFLVAIIHTLVCKHVCMLGGARLPCKIAMFFFFCTNVEFVWFESWVKTVAGREISLQPDELASDWPLSPKMSLSKPLNP